MALLWPTSLSASALYWRAQEPFCRVGGHTEGWGPSVRSPLGTPAALCRAPDVSVLTTAPFFLPFQPGEALRLLYWEDSVRKRAKHQEKETDQLHQYLFPERLL